MKIKEASPNYLLIPNSKPTPKNASSTKTRIAKMSSFPARHFSINQYKPNQATPLSVDFEKK
jgi:hypothetical protein